MSFDEVICLRHKKPTLEEYVRMAVVISRIRSDFHILCGMVSSNFTARMRNYILRASNKFGSLCSDLDDDLFADYDSELSDRWIRLFYADDEDEIKSIAALNDIDIWSK